MQSSLFDVAERARRFGAPRPQIVDADDDEFLVAQRQAAAVVGEHVGAGALERLGDAIGGRPVIVIAEDREHAGLRAAGRFSASRNAPR